MLVLDLQRQTSALEPSSSEELKTWELSEIEQNETLVDSLLANFPLSAKDLEAMSVFLFQTLRACYRYSFQDYIHYRNFGRVSSFSESSIATLQARKVWQ